MPLSMSTLMGSEVLRSGMPSPVGGAALMALNAEAPVDRDWETA